VSSPALVVVAVDEDPHKNDEDDAKKRPSIAATSIVAPGPSEEDLRRIVLESLASNESTKVDALIARVATAERDASHYMEMYEVVKAKYDTLKCRIETAGGTQNELRIKYAEQQGFMDGYEKEVRRLEMEMSTLTSRYELDHEAYERERNNMKDEIMDMKETHAAEIQRLMDEAKSLAKETHDHDIEGYDDIVTKLNEAIQRNERLMADNAAANDVMLTRIAKLEESEVNLKSLLDVEKIDNDANRIMIVELRNNVATHVATITKHEKNVSRLENEVHSITQALDDANRQMERMYSPRTGDALQVEVDELREKLSTMKDENVKLQGTMRERDEAYQTLSSQLDVTVIERDEFETRLSDTSIAVDEATAKAAKLKVKMQQLTEELQTAHAKQTENEGMLEEMAEENEQLIVRLEETESIMKQRLEEASRNADELTLKFDTVTAERDMLDEKLMTVKGELTSLQDQISEHEVEFATLQHTIQSLQSDKQVSDSKVLELSTQLSNITEQLESTKSTITILESKLRSKEEYCEQFESIERQLREEKRVLNEIRANLHNRVIQLSGNIRVFVRVRPLVESERLLTSSQVQPTRYQFASRSGASNSSSRPSSRGSMGPTASRPASRDGDEMNDESSCPFHFPAITDRNTTRPSSSSSGDGGGSFHDLTKQVIELTEPYKDRGGLKERRKKWKYGFDRVFNQSNGQRDVWEGAEPLVQSCIDGFHVCMFAYGQVSYFDRVCILIHIIHPVLTTTFLS
jgi:chromosome segregation ATPase